MTPGLMFTTSGPRGHMLCSGFAYCTKCCNVRCISTADHQRAHQHHSCKMWSNGFSTLRTFGRMLCHKYQVLIFLLSAPRLFGHIPDFCSICLFSFKKYAAETMTSSGTLTQKLLPSHVMKYLSEHITQLSFTSRIPLLPSSWDDITSCQSKIATQLCPPSSFLHAYLFFYGEPELILRGWQVGELKFHSFWDVLEIRR